MKTIAILEERGEYEDVYVANVYIGKVPNNFDINFYDNKNGGCDAMYSKYFDFCVKSLGSKKHKIWKETKNDKLKRALQQEGFKKIGGYFDWLVNYEGFKLVEHITG